MEKINLIVVNINSTVEKLSLYQATKRAWKFDIEEVKKFNPSYVIGISNDKILSVFKYLDVFNDFIEPERVEFQLGNCSKEEEFLLRKVISSENLKFVTIKYLTIVL